MLKEIDGVLNDDERDVMEAVAVCLGYPTTRDALTAILDGESPRRALAALSERFLLTISESKRGKAYSQHTIVQAFYYDQLGKRKRATLHQRAGAYYETDDVDLLRAARHCAAAGEQTRAAQLATRDVWALINQGQAHALRQLLESFKAESLDATQGVNVAIARGEVYDLLGEGMLARASYEAALAKLETLPDAPPVRERKARVCRGMGELLRAQSPPEALEWLRRGLAFAAEAHSVEEAVLHVRIGAVLIAMGDQAAATESLEKGLSLLPAEANGVRATALSNLANLYLQQGQFARAKDHTLRVLQIRQHLQDSWGIVAARHNLGILLEIAGEWLEAEQAYRQALTLAEHVGSAPQQAREYLSLGSLAIKQGRAEQAEKQLKRCETLAHQHNLKRVLAYVLCNFASVHIQRRDWDGAESVLRAAEQMAAALNAKALLPEFIIVRRKCA